VSGVDVRFVGALTRVEEMPVNVDGYLWLMRDCVHRAGESSEYTFKCYGHHLIELKERQV
jgi:hypothetical protein